MLAKTYSAALSGVDGLLVEIEVNTSGDGDSRVTIVGLPDAAIRESRERVKSAIYSSGFPFPVAIVTVNLAPADIKKEGVLYDLGIALGMLSTMDVIDPFKLLDCVVVGELALDGMVRPVKGILSIAVMAKRHEKSTLIVPLENAKEAALVDGLKVIGVKTLQEAAYHLSGKKKLVAIDSNPDNYFKTSWKKIDDFQDVKGQQLAKRAFEIAAAGGHNLCQVGSPGTGKSMLAKRLGSILPPLSMDEALETTKVHSVSGLTTKENPLCVQRPFRSPHHTISDAGLLGGQSNPRPGEVSLAHHGVLFLDELPEFRRSTLEVLRQPLEDHEVTISRASGTVTFPAFFQLIAAMNPCPCGFLGSKQRKCRCTSAQVERYRSKISGPLLDRIDLHVEVLPISKEELMSAPTGEPSQQIRNRVIDARERQINRFKGRHTKCNAMMAASEIRTFCELDDKGREVLSKAMDRLNLSPRAYDRILKVARTIADLAGANQILAPHIIEAVQYRTLDRKMW
ncbi:MAG: YifB family Mg chelatase-like AAA ATPase [Lentisphaeria bacterium]|nr:YifB family Mg chelatase-like AAA ATPase [Lentisphaeria bacterium]